MHTFYINFYTNDSQNPCLKIQPPHFKFASYVYALDVDECASGNGSCTHTCNNMEGSYYCSCREGYKLASNGKICSDINECTVGVRCDHTCVNSDGSFHCKCAGGYLLNETDEKSCIGQFVSQVETKRKNSNLLFYFILFFHHLDVDECLVSNGGCHHVCNNKNGSHSCSCRQGYALEANTTQCLGNH